MGLKENGINVTTERVIGAAVAVHRELGPGLLESVYQTCLCHELALRGVPFRPQVPLPIRYRGIHLDGGLRLDLIVNEEVIVELKSVDRMIPLYTAQVITYLRLSGFRVGLLINFNAPLLKDGITRLIR